MGIFGVGKTTALVEIIKAGTKAMERDIDELVIIYTQEQAAYMEMATKVPVVKLVRLGDQFKLHEFLELLGDDKSKTKAIIFDDVEQSKASGIWQVILECVTRLAHHLNAYVFFTTHLLFVEKNEFRVIQRNCAYLLLFPSIRDRSSIAVLARRCFPAKPQVLVKAFEHLLANAAKFSYVILDLRPRLTSEIFRIRHSFILDAPLVSYLPKSELSEYVKTERPNGYAA